MKQALVRPLLLTLLVVGGAAHTVLFERPGLVLEAQVGLVADKPII